MSEVHAIDVRGPKGAWPNWLRWRYLRPDTDVIIHNEHGNVCQFTYQEWEAFAVKMVRGEFSHIGDYVSPEDIVPVAEPRKGDRSTCAKCGAEIVRYESPSGMMKGWNHVGTSDRSHVAEPTGMDPSAMARIDALPDATVEISGTFDAAESGGSNSPDLSDVPIKGCPDGELHQSHPWIGFDPEMADLRMCPGVRPYPSDQRITWDSGQGNYGCATCESSDGCAECRV